MHHPVSAEDRRHRRPDAASARDSVPPRRTRPPPRARRRRRGPAATVNTTPRRAPPAPAPRRSQRSVPGCGAGTGWRRSGRCPLGLHPGLAGVGAIAQHQVAAGRKTVQQPLHDRLRLVVIAEVAQDSEQHERDRPVEVQGAGGQLEDPVGIAQVGVDVGGHVLGAGEQGTGVGQHHRVVVDTDDAALRGDPLGHLVGVVGGGQAGADVQELAAPAR
jgi:hypothetical protein